MPFRIDADEFLQVALPAIREGDAPKLARVVGARWRVPELCGLLQHPNVDVRRVAAVTLGMVGNRPVIGCLTRALRDRDEQVNQMAEHGLWSVWFRLGDPQAAGPFREGVGYLATESHAQAIRCFQLATQIDPEFAEAYNQCAIAHFFTNDWQKAIEDSRQTLRRIPTHFGAIAGMGHCYTQLGELDRALECYQRALAINPRMPTIARMIDRLESRQRLRNDLSGEFLVDQTSR